MYLVIHDSNSKHKYSEVDIKEMLGLLIDNIFVGFDNQIFQHTVGIFMDTDCAPLLGDLLLYSYEAEFIQNIYMKRKPLAVAFNSTFRYNDDFIYPSELEIKETTESYTSASYWDALLSIDDGGKLTTQFYDKRDDINFASVNFPYIYVATPHCHLHITYVSVIYYIDLLIVYISLSTDSICKSLLYIQWVFESG
jgi:hypothetical protein